MATCLINAGRKEPCKTNFGGLYKIFILNYNTLASTGITYSGGTFDEIIGITGDTATTKIYEYELKGTNTFNESLATLRENGTLAVTQTLTLSLKGLSKEDNRQIRLLGYGRPQIFVQFNDGSMVYAGKDFGMELQTSVADHGTAPGDAVAYTLTFVGVEKEYANVVVGSTLLAPFTSVGGAGFDDYIVKGV